MVDFAPAPALDRAPALTLPPAEAAFLRHGYEQASVILEYGSGGSTAMAAEMPGKAIWSVESDWSWMKGLEDWFKSSKPASPVNMRHGDIGPTGKWGRPTGPNHFAKFHNYPLAVWDEPGFRAPDTVFIDGRFRAACFLAVAYRTEREVTIYFDDYIGRPAYHVVERFGKPTEVVGRMAQFHLAPQKLSGADLGWIMDVFSRVQ